MYEDVKTKMDKAIHALENDYAAIRAGRANPALLDKVTVDYYGIPTPIPQVGTVSVPEARMLVVQPWDGSILGDIEKAILKSDLGLTPNNDGKVIRINFPALTEERRKELVKGISKRAEEAKVVIRGVRRDALEAFKAQKKKSEITEDDLKQAETDIQKLTDQYIKDIDGLSAKKEKEIMEI
ncbi:MAG: ribosome recycling factor [Ruminococcaceae bacterium]|nr:ribosome recycling factor [Oscillospiraceae bacterium]